LCPGSDSYLLEKGKQIEIYFSTVHICFTVEHRKNLLISGEKSGIPGFFFFFNQNY